MSSESEDQAKQIYYRDARFTKQYDDIWQSVGKCVFCDLKEKYIFFEENGVVMTISLFAYIDGHFMIVPRRHIKSIKELTEAEWTSVRKFTYIAKKLVREVHGVKGLQVLQKDGSNAQSTVDQHLHLHCVPFDAPDLSVWNYRQLQHTPLENVQLYRDAGKRIIKASQKFDQQYVQPSTLPIICDAVIINDKNQVLLQERTTDASMMPPHDTLPGGMVENFTRSLEEELARELHEEAGLMVKADQLQLVASRIDMITYLKKSDHLHKDYSHEVTILWNTYCLKNFDSAIKLKAGGDAKRLYWLAVDEAVRHTALTPSLQQVIAMARDA